MIFFYPSNSKFSSTMFSFFELWACSHICSYWHSWLNLTLSLKVKSDTIIRTRTYDFLYPNNNKFSSSMHRFQVMRHISYNCACTEIKYGRQSAILDLSPKIKSCAHAPRQATSLYQVWNELICKLFRLDQERTKCVRFYNKDGCRSAILDLSSKIKWRAFALL